MAEHPQPTREQLLGLTVDQLRRLARQARIALRSGLRKAQIVDLLLRSGKPLTLPPPRAKRPVRRRVRVLGLPKRRKEAAVPSGGPARETLPAPSWDLPPGYGEPRVTLLPRDPFWAFAYWEIPPDHLQRLCEAHGEDTYTVVLRLYDIWGINFDGTNAHRSFDLEVFQPLGSWYISFWSPQGAYCAEIGLRFPDGRFAAAARSNPIQLPPDAPSIRTTETWMEVPWEEEAGRPPQPGVPQRVPAVPSRRVPAAARPFAAETFGREFPYRKPDASGKS